MGIRTSLGEECAGNCLAYECLHSPII